MTFASPFVLLALLAIPLLAWWYAVAQRGRAQAAEAFVVPVLRPSVTPRRPRWRRHVPMLAFALALALLILAAARPQRSVAVPIDSASIMLANDISGSMAATDVRPSRLQAAETAAGRFLASLPAAAKIGLIAFNSKPRLLQSPTDDHGLVSSALKNLRVSGGTAMGDALQMALKTLARVPKVAGKQPPGAIVLISDGTSDVGSSPVTAARRAASAHIPVYTVSVGTTHGTITYKKNGRTVTDPAPPSPQQLAQIARVSHGQAFTATDAKGLNAIYRRLASRLGHKTVKHEISASFAGGGLVLLLLGSGMSLVWFGRLA
jgi:Ca-activated chloride channel homolog